MVNCGISYNVLLISIQFLSRLRRLHQPTLSAKTLPLVCLFVHPVRYCYHDIS